MDTYNIKDLWICKKCGRFGYSKFRKHTKKIGSSAICLGSPVMFATWIRKKREGKL